MKTLCFQCDRYLIWKQGVFVLQAQKTERRLLALQAGDAATTKDFFGVAAAVRKVRKTAAQLGRKWSSRSCYIAQARPTMGRVRESMTKPCIGHTHPANMIRSLLREFGHILPIGIEAVTAFAKRHLGGDHPDMPEIANGMLGIQCYQFIGLNARIEGYSKMIEQHALLNADARRLMRMPGIGPITASAIVATIGDAKQFRTGRDLAAWLGLTPLNKSSGGKERLGRRRSLQEEKLRSNMAKADFDRDAVTERNPASGKQ